MTTNVSSTLCKIGQKLNISVEVFPDTPVTVYWRWNKTDNWTTGPLECKELGWHDLHVMVENAISVVSSECYNEILVVDYNFTFNPEIGALNSTVEITRSSVAQISDETNYTFILEFEDESIRCPNKTFSKVFTTANPDPGHLVTLWIYNQEGHATFLQKYIKVYEPVEPPIKVSYKNISGKNKPIDFVIEPHKGHGVIYRWEFGDNSTVLNSTNRTTTHTFSSTGDFCVLLSVTNFFSEALINLKMTVVTAIDGFGFVKNITTVQTGSPTNIGIEVRNGSNVNVSIDYGDGSPPLWIVNIDDVLDIFVISVWHNYSAPGLYNVSIKALNVLSTHTATSIADVQDPVRNLTIEKKYDTPCLEVNGTLRVHLTVNGSKPRFIYNFGDKKNVTSSELIRNHSYITHGDYELNITAFNDISSVFKMSTVTVCKPVVLLVGLIVTSPPTNLSDNVEFTLNLGEGSDFECVYNYGDGSFDYFGKNCFNKTYFADGVTTDKTPFLNLEFKVSHNYSDAGFYTVFVNCSNRLKEVNFTSFAIVQKPIEELVLPEISPKILGRYNPITWTMENGTNVTFSLEADGTNINYTSFKTDTGDVLNTSLSHIYSVGVYLVKLRAQNKVSEASRSITLIIQIDVTDVTFKTWTTTSDFGSNIPGFGSGNNIFPCEYPVNFTAEPNNGTNLTFWWRFEDDKEKNTSEATTTHKFAEAVGEYWTNVTVFNLVSSVTRMFVLKTEKSIMGLTIDDDSPVKINRTTSFQLGFSKFGTKTCINMDMGDNKGFFVFGGSYCPGNTGDIDENSNSYVHRYNYSSIDEFWVKIVANNTVSNQTLEYKSVIVELSCFYPNASLSGVSANVGMFTKKKRSESIQIMTELEVDCEASKTTLFKWKCFKISSNQKVYTPLPGKGEEIPLAVDDQAELNIPKTGLDFGFYRLEFTVSMANIEGVSGSAEGYIQVVPTNNSLTAFVDGGLYKRYKFGKNITMNATGSKDIDFPKLSEASPRYFWLCRNSTEPEFDTSGDLTKTEKVRVPCSGSQNKTENLGGCFKTGKGRLNISGPIGYINSRGMSENSTYFITLVVIDENPFWSNRAVFNHKMEIVIGDPPEVEVKCSPVCASKVNIDQKLPLRGTCIDCYGELDFRWQLYRQNGADPTKTGEMEPVKHLDKKSSTGDKSLNLALKKNILVKDEQYVAVFRAYRLSGQYGEFIHTFETNSPPENGTCEIHPKIGYAMNTSFRINCSHWMDPDQPLTYEFAYVNYYQDNVFFTSHEPISSSVLLPMGHESKNFTLHMRLKVIDRFGAANVSQITIQVKPTDLSGDKLHELISGKDGLLKEAKKRGNLQEMVEIINAVGSILNYQGRQAGDAVNRSAEDQASAKSRQDFRRDILKDLSEFKLSTVGHVKLLASAIDVATEVRDEVDTKSQELAMFTFQEMDTMLTKESQNNAGFKVVRDTVGSFLGGLSNVLISAASMAKVENADSTDNITGFTGNSSTGGKVSVKERAQNRTLKLVSLVDDLGHTVLENMVAGEPSVSVKTRNFNLTVKKDLFQDLGNTSLTDEYTKFKLPSLEDMGLGLDKNGSRQYTAVELQMTTIPNNLYTWSNTSKQVNSYAVSLNIKDESRNPLDTSNFSKEADLYIPRNASNLPKHEEFYLKPFGDRKFIQYHQVDVNSANYSVHIQVRPVNESVEKITVLLRYNERPTLENFDHNWTIPDLRDCSYKKESRLRNSSLPGSASNMTNSSATNSSGIEQIPVIDVARHCKRDPYTVSISNEVVTKSGKYYLAIFYEEPEPEVEEVTSSSNVERRRREIDLEHIPIACRGAHGRMKRSCVIIPPPPPKPTTPPTQLSGTRPANVDYQGNPFNPNDTEHYLMRVFSSNCLFWDEKSGNWINKGCKVGEETTPELVHCKCNHLTSFASDFLVAPNPIDFDKVFSADLSKNFAVLLVVCLLFGLYFVLIIIARRFDRRDLDKLGATAVRNRNEASFPYLISIHTGVRQNAGTTSSVYIVLSGDEWESTPMALVDLDRRVFQRGQENNFVITLPRRLGNLSHIRIWHDNYGTNASWYLSRVSVEDLRTEDRWYFICERWLAVEEDDGKVERILPVASEQELTHFQHLFVSKTVRELGDGHLWFSVVTRPATSPFTRVQRVSCCLSLLCCTMVTNAMFYRMGGEGEKATMIQIGSFEFDLRGFIIGIQASLIVFPVNFALVQIFRNVRPKQVKQEQNMETVEKQGTGFADISKCSSTETLQNASSQEKIIKKDDGDKRNKDDKKKGKKGLPHWLVYVAWILCFFSSVTPAVFTVFYSLSWGPEIANKWLLAFVTSFFQSILIIQPLKVVLAALLFAIIVKKPIDSGDEAHDKKEVKASPVGEETGDDILLDFDEDDERYRPPDEDFLQAARAQRLKEVRMSEIIKEIVTYFLFLILLMLVAYGNRDPNTYLLRKTLHETFVDLDQTGVDFSDASDLELFWHWNRETLIPNLYPGVLYNNKSDKYTGFISDRNNYLVGISRLRQARVEKDSCEVDEHFTSFFDKCYAEYSLLNEDTEDYDIGWKFLNKSAGDVKSRRKRSVQEQFAFRKGDKILKGFGEQPKVRRRRTIEPVYTSTSGRQQRKRKRPGSTAKNYYVLNSAILPDGSIVSCPSRWLHNSALELRGYPFWGRLTLYNGGGYPAELGYDYPTALTVVADLHSHNWVDPQTRSVFVEFTVYNANTNLFGIAFMFVEFLPTGGGFPYAHFAVARLYSYVGPFANFILACQIFLILFMLYFMYREGKQMYKQRRAYFRGFFNWMEVTLIICEFAMVILYFARLWEVDKNLMKLRYNPKDFVSFQYAGAADESLTVIMGVLVFLVTLRFLKLFRFNKRMALIGSTLGAVAKPLGMFCISFMIVYIAYATMAWLAFGIENDKFRNFLVVLETQMSIVLGDFDYDEFQSANRLLGPIYFFSFMYFSVFYLLNMFMAIINDTFSEVKSSNDKQKNEYEMVEFIISRFKENLGLNRNRIGTSKSPFVNPSSGFPSSPPFSPSDYKHREDDSASEKTEQSRMEYEDELHPTRSDTQSVFRTLSALDKHLDELTAFVKKSEKHVVKSDEMLLDMIDKIQNETGDDELYDQFLNEVQTNL
ncbi:uncharacterized protein LOC111321123 [Stylophora pistillata]|uniref:uncharacterized protein LOC111321123 n=1 Tax=Stylophora pistillata TaxID=50429 RepID=UPI000C04BA47|nr:uncharacterized protein LOC111321123 [Stylophora pistillata]